MNKYKVGQTLFQILWKQGTPYLSLKKVVKATKSTYYIEGDIKPSNGWFEDAVKAFDNEYLAIFRQWDTMFSSRLKESSDLTIDETVEQVCKVRRLQKRLLSRNKSKQNN